MSSIRSNNAMVRMCAAALLISSLYLASCAAGGKGSAEKVGARERYAENTAALAYQQAERDFRVSDLKSALQNISVAIERQPENAEYAILKGRILCEMNNLEEAMSAFNQAIDIDAGNSSAHYYQGVVYQRWSDDIRAVDSYKVAFDLVPSDLYYFSAYVETLLATRRFEEAHEAFDRSSVYFSHNASVQRLRGHLALLEGHPDSAAEHFYQAILVAPEDTALVENLIIALYESEQYVRCRHYVEQLLKREEFSQRVDLLHFKALCLVATDNLIDARFAYLNLLKLNPDNPTLWSEFGVLAYRLGDWRRVEETAYKQVAQWPNRYDGYLLRGLHNEHIGNLEAAVSDYQQAARLAPESTHATLLLGLAFQQLGRDEEAKAAFETARKARPDDPELHTLLAGFGDGGDEIGRW